MLPLKLIVISICAVCKLIGELSWHNAQRYVMPLIFSIAVSTVSHVWWLGFTTLPMIAGLVEGYKVYGESDGFDRAMWLMVIAILMGIGPCIAGHLSWYVYAPYCVLCAIWGGVTRKWLNLVIAPISGALLGSIILFIH